MNRTPIVLAVGTALLAAQACAPVPRAAVQPGDLARTRTLLIDSLGRFVNPTPLHERYVQALVGAFEVSTVGRDGADEVLTIAWLKPPGSYCWHNVKKGGMEAPESLNDPSEATRALAFDRAGNPLYQISIAPWSEMAIVDVDGNPATSELVLWSENCEGGDPPFLKILGLAPDGCRPMLDLVLNPGALKSRSYLEKEVIQTKDGPETVYNRRTRTWPERLGRWRFEGNSLLIEEMSSANYKTVARFEFDPAAETWRGPAGGDEEMWKTGGETWVQSEFLSFRDLKPGHKLDISGGFGSLRKDVDHLKAAEEAAREAGLK